VEEAVLKVLNKIAGALINTACLLTNTNILELSLQLKRLSYLVVKIAESL